MLSLTFVSVRIMSMTGSTEMTSPAIVTGKFMAPRTIKAAKVAPPPTPATPKELIVTTKINVNTKPMLVTSMPKVGATMVANMAG